MKKNVASQVIVAQLNALADGTAVTSGTTTVYVLGDGGTQASGSGTVTHEGQGAWSYVPTQAETNYDHVAFTFVNSSAIAQTVQVYTTFPQTGDSYARLGAPAGASVSADIAAIDGVVDSILVDTAEIGVAGAGLTNIDLPDQTMNITGNITGNISGSVGSVTGNVGGIAGTINTLDALDAAQDAQHATTQADIAALNDIAATDVWAAGTRTLTAATNISGPIADQVWEEALADHSATVGSTAEALAAAGSAGDPWATALPGAYGAGSAGNIIGNAIPAIDSNVDAVLLDTNELQGDWADGGRLDAILDARASQVTADAIEADTQDIQSRIPAALVGGRIDSNMGAVSGDATAANNLKAMLDGTGGVDLNLRRLVIHNNSGTDAALHIENDGLAPAAMITNLSLSGKGLHVLTYRGAAVAMENDDSAAALSLYGGVGLSIAGNTAGVQISSVLYSDTQPAIDVNGFIDIDADTPSPAISITNADATGKGIEVSTTGTGATVDLNGEIDTDTITQIATAVGDQVWDEALSGHVTAGSAGAAIGDIEGDTQDIQARIPAALVGGRMLSDMQAVSGDSAAADNLETMLDGTGGGTLSLAHLNVVANSADAAVYFENLGSGLAAYILNLTQTGNAFKVEAYRGKPLEVYSDDTTAAVTLSGGGGLLVSGLNYGMRVNGGTDLNGQIDTDTINQIANAIWTAVTRTLSAATNITAPIADAVWDEALADHLTAGTTGAALDTAVDNIAVPADIADAVAALTIETGYTLQQTLQLIGAAVAGKLSGAATVTNTIRSMDDSANRIVATVDADGNRTAVTHNV